MTEFKCIVCWRPLEAEEGQKKIICPHCGKEQRVPKKRKAEKINSILPEEYLAQKRRKRNALLAAAGILAGILIYVGIVSPLMERKAVYEEAVSVMEDGRLAEAYDILFDLNIKDSSELAASIKAEADLQRFSEAKTGDCIFFGTYEQDKKKWNGAEQIEWMVLDRQEDRMLLLSSACLERHCYHSENMEITWADSDVRQWLNGEFLETAFQEDDRQWILTVINENPDNSMYGTDGGEDTEDQIFLLSEEEAQKYFANDLLRQATAGEHVRRQKSYQASNGNYIWWLRTPGYSSKTAMWVESTGGIDLFGRDVNAQNQTVRPAVWVRTSLEE